MSCIFCKGKEAMTIPLYSDESGARVTVSNKGELVFTEGSESLGEWAMLLQKKYPKIDLPEFPKPIQHRILIDRCPICGQSFSAIKASKEENYTLVCNVCGAEAKKTDYKEFGRDSISTYDTTTCKCMNGRYRHTEQNKQVSKEANLDKLHEELKKHMAKVRGGLMWINEK